MPQVNVTIAGRNYRMGCDEGQERALVELASDLDARIVAFREEFGEIGDMRLLIMTALALSDELGEARGRLAATAREIEHAVAASDAARRDAEEARELYAAALDEAAARVERLTRALTNGEIDE